jgi:hypothetical protein
MGCQLGPPKQTARYSAVSENLLEKLPDLSYLNKPITRPVEIRNGKLYANNEQLKLFGTSLSFSDSIPNREDAIRVTQLLKRLGFNYVRLHHFDTYRYPKGIISRKHADSQHLDPVAMDRLSFFIHELGKNGVYVGLSLLVGRQFTKEDGVVQSETIPARNKSVSYFDERVIELNREMTLKILNHHSPYSGLKLSREPALASLELRNEDSLVRTAKLRRLAKLPSHYLAKLREKWNKFDGSELLDSLERSPERVYLFLANIEKEFCDRQAQTIRNTGSKANVTCSQVHYGTPYSFIRESDMHVTSITSYWDHPEFPQFVWDERNWIMHNRPMVGDKNYGLFSEMALHGLEGRPYFIIEYNHPAPNEYSAETIPLVIPFAHVQDFDAVNLFEFSLRQSDKIENFFSIRFDPAKYIFFPAAALAFRSPESCSTQQKNYNLVLDPKAQMKEVQDLWQENGLRPEEILNSQTRVRVVPGKTTTLESYQSCRDTFAISWKPAERRFLSRSQSDVMLTGLLEKEWIYKGIRIVNLEQTPRWVSISISTLDRKAIELSNDLYIATIGDARNEGLEWNSTRTSVGKNWGQGPVKITRPKLSLEMGSRCKKPELSDLGVGSKLPAKTLANDKIQLDFHSDSIAHRLKCLDQISKETLGGTTTRTL